MGKALTTEFSGREGGHDAAAEEAADAQLAQVRNKITPSACSDSESRCRAPSRRRLWLFDAWNNPRR